VGDALIAVDDVDVRNMNAVQVSKLISRKSGQEVRKLSLLRRQQYPSDQLMNIGIVSGEDVYGLR
jgi:C-terminal processing protease CtpA/Prc